MRINDIAQQVQLRVEDKDGTIYTSQDVAKAIDSANQRIVAYLDKKYLSRLLHEQTLNTFLDDSGSTIAEGTLYYKNQFLTNHQYSFASNNQTTMATGASFVMGATKDTLWKGYFLLSDLTNNVQKNQYGYELAFDQIESAYLIPNSYANYGAKIQESVVWIHITDQLGRYELENSYMYTPDGSSPVLVRTAETKNNQEHEVKYMFLPSNLPMFGSIQLIYYKKPRQISNINNLEPEVASVAHEALVFLACAELLHSDGESGRSQAMHQKGLEIIGALNSKVGNMDVTKKQSNI
jgi:hypothetical protein